MRKIMAQGVEWTMGSADGETLRVAAAEEPHAVTLTNNYYIGVFEVTQAQWKNIATNSSLAANFTVDGAMRPMEKTSYNEIRNAADSATADPSYDWPADPNPSSFLGLLRSKTGLDFDLPSEAQWEFAARAGNGSGFWNDGSEVQNLYRDTNLDALGRNLHNNPTGESSTSAERMDPSLAPENGGTAIVGSYTPSDWGLYDMHGNVWEWCLDYYQNDITDYGGKVNVHATLHGYTISGVPASDRTLRGGCYRVTADQCRSAYRTGFGPQNRTDHTGFRVVCTAGLR